MLPQPSQWESLPLRVLWEPTWPITGTGKYSPPFHPALFYFQSLPLTSGAGTCPGNPIWRVAKRKKVPSICSLPGCPPLMHTASLLLPNAGPNSQSGCRSLPRSASPSTVHSTNSSGSRPWSLPSGHTNLTVTPHKNDLSSAFSLLICSPSVARRCGHSMWCTTEVGLRRTQACHDNHNSGCFWIKHDSVLMNYYLNKPQGGSPCNDETKNQ